MEDQNPEVMQILSQNLKTLRKNAGLTQEKLAEQVGVSANTIGKIEKGLEFPKALLLQNLINFFHLRPFEIFKDQEKDKILTVEQINTLQSSLNSTLNNFTKQDSASFPEKSTDNHLNADNQPVTYSTTHSL